MQTISIWHRCKGHLERIRVRGPALFGRKGGFQRAQHHRSLFSRIRRISRFASAQDTLCPATLLPLSDMRYAARTCKLPSNRPASSVSELYVKLWPSSTLLWRLTSAIRGLGESMTEETVSRYRGQGRPVVLLLSASRPGECIQIVGCCSAGESLRRSAKVCID